MSQALIKREYYVDVDDLVDQLLDSVRQNGWTLSKMQYESSKLEATRRARKPSPNGDKKNEQLVFHLVAEWKDLGDAVELLVTVDSATPVAEVSDCREECAKVCDKLPEARSYQNLYSGDPGAIFEEFENNN
jgi:hypothetical protein